MSSSNILFPPTLENRILYYEDDHEENKITHIGGLFNSMYPFDWHKIIHYSGIQFQLTFDGDLDTIQFILHHSNEHSEVIYEQSLKNEAREITIQLPEFEPVSGQRISVKVKHSKSGAQIEHASWKSFHAEPPKEVTLAIVICTHNKEALLTRNVSKLLNSEVWELEPISLIIINNGELSDTFDFKSYNRIKLIDQPNLGGSGGFGRGIYEVISNSEEFQNPSHILLMDDDVSFEPEIISRTINLYKYASDKVCIGGSMLKLEEPTCLHEAGSNTRSKKSIGTKTDITQGLLEETNALEQLGRAHTYDYNAWWYSSFPREAVTKIGLPLPIFIHGDDIEYGLRLNQDSYKIYCPGGISLWHECFENKHSTWVKYFDFRNAFIRLAIHGDNQPRVLLTQLGRIFKRCVMRNDYGSCIMLIEAFKDFCKGHEVLNCKQFDSKIKYLTEIYNQNTQSPSSSRYRLAGRSAPRKKLKLIQKQLKYITTNFHYLPLKTRGVWTTENARYAWWDIPYLHDVRVCRKGAEDFDYIRCRITAKKLQKELSNLKRQFKVNSDEYLADWRHSAKELVKLDFWEKYTS